jgi:hypothetical protein
LDSDDFPVLLEVDRSPTTFSNSILIGGVETPPMRLITSLFSFNSSFNRAASGNSHIRLCARV